jgi:sulfide:quinone oxidoreductase
MAEGTRAHSVEPMPLHHPYRVLIAGGGPAAIEAALTLQRIAVDRVAVTVVAPGNGFVPGPMTVLEPFAAGGPEHRTVAELVAAAGATLRRGKLARVDARTRSVRLTDGATLDYDALLVAVGAVPRIPYPDTLTFGMPGTSERMHGLIQDVEAGYVRRIAFVLPAGASWPLPLYELALMTANRAWEMGLDTELTFVTPEPKPLALFGPEASEAVTKLLGATTIDVHTGTHAEVQDPRTLVLCPEGQRIEVDRIVTLAILDGPAIEGLPRDAAGFLPIDRYGRVAGVEDVYAAGDAANFDIKQGGLACQQADAAAEAIAAAAGLNILPKPFKPVLRGVLLTEQDARFMQRDASGTSGDTSMSAAAPLWWPPTKIAGRELSQHLGDIRARTPSADRGGVEVDQLVGTG